MPELMRVRPRTALVRPLGPTVTARQSREHRRVFARVPDTAPSSPIPLGPSPATSGAPRGRWRPRAFGVAATRSPRTSRCRSTRSRRYPSPSSQSARRTPLPVGARALQPRGGRCPRRAGVGLRRRVRDRLGQDHVRPGQVPAAATRDPARLPSRLPAVPGQQCRQRPALARPTPPRRATVAK